MYEIQIYRCEAEYAKEFASTSSSDEETLEEFQAAG